MSVFYRKNKHIGRDSPQSVCNTCCRCSELSVLATSCQDKFPMKYLRGRERMREGDRARGERGVERERERERERE